LNDQIRISTFEIVLLVVGLTASILGFHLINKLYIAEGEISRLMVIAIFNWLMILVLFVSLSIAVDVSKKQLNEIKNLIRLFNKKLIKLK